MSSAYGSLKTVYFPSSRPRLHCNEDEFSCLALSKGDKWSIQFVHWAVDAFCWFVKSKTGLNRYLYTTVFIIMKSSYQFTAQIERDKETGLYLGIVPNLPGAHTQAASLDELQANLKEVIALCLEELSAEELSELSEFIGFQQISVAI